MTESGNLGSGEGEGVKLLENGEVEKMDARLPVTQPDDPLSGGHFALGTSKPPLGSTRESSGVVVHVVTTKMTNGKHTRHVSREESPISNGLTTVGGAKTRFRF